MAVACFYAFIYLVYNIWFELFAPWVNMKSSDAKASKCYLKFSSRMTIFIKLVYLSSVISLKWQ